ncbi:MULTISPECIES: hydrogenase subunit MbhD domain-containing protein [unclassified Streptomyces]|uniref:hydrogenase subunit MbhD domain-containing protein n=1 Tax=unclassified Streptomyces TaxID=2593676 RepID=UPI00336A3227
MADDLPLLLGLLLVAAAGTGTVLVRDPVRQSFLMSLLGLALATLFLLLQAPDVALSQLAVGAALTPLMVLLSVHKVRRRARGERREERE